MSNDLIVPDAMSPEGMLVIEAYLESGSDVAKAALAVGMEEPKFREIMRKPEVKAYLSGTDKPKWLLVSTNPETLKYYGDVVEAYYQPTATANEEFVIYLRK